MKVSREEFIQDPSKILELAKTEPVALLREDGTTSGIISCPPGERHIELTEDYAGFWAQFSDEEISNLLRAAPKIAVWKRTKLGTISLDGVRTVTQNLGIVTDDTKGLAGFVTVEGISERVRKLKDAGYRIPNTPETPER